MPSVSKDHRQCGSCSASHSWFDCSIGISFAVCCTSCIASKGLFACNSCGDDVQKQPTLQEMQSNQALMLLNNTLFASEWCIRVVVMLLNNSTEQSAWGRCSNYQLVASANNKASVSCMFGLTILQFCWLGVGGKFRRTTGTQCNLQTTKIPLGTQRQSHSPVSHLQPQAFFSIYLLSSFVVVISWQTGAGASALNLGHGRSKTVQYYMSTLYCLHQCGMQHKQHSLQHWVLFHLASCSLKQKTDQQKQRHALETIVLWSFISGAHLPVAAAAS